MLDQYFTGWVVGWGQINIKDPPSQAEVGVESFESHQGEFHQNSANQQVVNYVSKYSVFFLLVCSPFRIYIKNDQKKMRKYQLD